MSKVDFKVMRNFGPSVMKVTIPEDIINKLNKNV